MKRLYSYSPLMEE